MLFKSSVELLGKKILSGHKVTGQRLDKAEGVLEDTQNDLIFVWIN